MIPVPPDIIARFQDFLDRKPVQKPFQAYYKKWLRFYWDFCQKYHHPVSQHESLSHFIEKLHQKKQKDYQIKQASDAVSLYYEIVKERPSVAEHVTIRKNTSVKKAEIFPHNDTTVFAAPAEKRSNAVKPGLWTSRSPGRVVRVSGPKIRRRRYRKLPVKRRIETLSDFLTKLFAINGKHRINRLKSAQAGNSPLMASVMKSWFGSTLPRH